MCASSPAAGEHENAPSEKQYLNNGGPKFDLVSEDRQSNLMCVALFLLHHTSHQHGINDDTLVPVG